MKNLLILLSVCSLTSNAFASLAPAETDCTPPSEVWTCSVLASAVDAILNDTPGSRSGTYLTTGYSKAEAFKAQFDFWNGYSAVQSAILGGKAQMVCQNVQLP